MNEPIGDDHGFFAVQVAADLYDDRAILTVGGDQIAIVFGDLAELSGTIGNLKCGCLS
jgi:hypothetical protein